MCCLMCGACIFQADAQLEHELRNFREMSLGYVSKLQEVNEKKKFEFVEIVCKTYTNDF